MRKRFNFLRKSFYITQNAPAHHEDWLRPLRNIQETLKLHSPAQSLPYRGNKNRLLYFVFLSVYIKFVRIVIKSY